MTEDAAPQKRQDQKLMALGPKSATFIFIVYLAIMATSAAYAFTGFTSAGPPEEHFAVKFCIALSLLGATVFYSRKLYKACINNSYNFESGSAVQMIGTLFYFLLRPAFAASFAWITHMIWEASIVASVNTFSEFSSTHIYLSGVLGFFVGFLAGRVLSRMEIAGGKHLLGVW